MQQTMNKPGANAGRTLTSLTVVLMSLIILLHHFFPESFKVKQFRVSRLSGSLIDDLKDIETMECTIRDVPVIPNIVHFIHLVDLALDPVFDFSFRQFIAIYSAWFHLKPEIVYIHTNVAEHLIEEALKSAANPYAKAISKIPSVTFRNQLAPNRTMSNRVIEKLPHQSDFVRTEVLSNFGGVYLDDDAYVLRDLKRFRYAGFENVVGQQLNGQICNAVILSSMGNKMIKAYRALQDTVFDNSWERHSIELLTTLANEFQIPDKHVLILPQDTLFPSAWWQEDLQMIYGVHKDTGDQPVNNKSPQNVTEFILNFKIDGPSTWCKDWRSSYVLHGWTSGIERNMEKSARHELFGSFKAITPAYVMARKSNFARAVYPAVKHAIDHDFLKDVRYDQD